MTDLLVTITTVVTTVRELLVLSAANFIIPATRRYISSLIPVSGRCFAQKINFPLMYVNVYNNEMDFGRHLVI